MHSVRAAAAAIVQTRFLAVFLEYFIVAEADSDKQRGPVNRTVRDQPLDTVDGLATIKKMTYRRLLKMLDCLVPGDR